MTEIKIYGPWTKFQLCIDCKKPAIKYETFPSMQYDGCCQHCGSFAGVIDSARRKLIYKKCNPLLQFITFGQRGNEAFFWERKEINNENHD